MLHSMTGFARQIAEIPAGTLTCELRAVNHRYLDVQFRLPDELRVKETELKADVSNVLKRGKVECSFWLKAPPEAAAGMELDVELVRTLSARIAELAAELPRAGEIDLLYDSVGDFMPVMDSIGWVRSRTDSAATTVIRGNQAAEIGGRKPYADRAVRRAMALAVDNAVCLELGYAGRGSVAANHHVSPIHPAYADIGPAAYDPDRALAEMRAAGMAGFAHELITIDDEWQRNTGDAVAALMRDAGLNVRRTILPGSTFWDNWKGYPFSSTEWNHRPLAVQALALAYRSGAAWNETGFAHAEFDALLDRAMAISDADARRGVMAQIETLLRDEGVIIQPYWRALFTHHAPGLLNAARHPANEIHLYKIGFSG